MPSTAALRRPPFRQCLPLSILLSFDVAQSTESSVVMREAQGLPPTLPAFTGGSPLARSTSGRPSDLTVGGADLAAQAFRAGLVDECRLVIHPVLVGGGKPALPSGTRVDLELLNERRLSNGVVHLRYGVRE